MKSWSDGIYYLLAVYYCIFGTALVNKYLFHNKLSHVGLGMLMAVVFISGYPLFGWRRNSVWPPRGKVPLIKWVWLAVGVGIATIVIDLFSSMVVTYFGGK